MARSSDPNSASSQFFIVVKDSNFLDGQYSAFGEVISGMDVADKIAAAPRGANDRPNSRSTSRRSCSRRRRARARDHGLTPSGRRPASKRWRRQTHLSAVSIEALAGDVGRRRYFRIALERQPDRPRRRLSPRGGRIPAALGHGPRAARGRRARARAARRRRPGKPDRGGPRIRRPRGALRGIARGAAGVARARGRRGGGHRRARRSRHQRALRRGALPARARPRARGRLRPVPRARRSPPESARRTTPGRTRSSREILGHPAALCHRDFHGNNLFAAGDRVAVIDFQDLRRGPDTYDLASLLWERTTLDWMDDAQASDGRRRASPRGAAADAARASARGCAGCSSSAPGRSAARSPGRSSRARARRTGATCRASSRSSGACSGTRPRTGPSARSWSPARAPVC